MIREEAFDSVKANVGNKNLVRRMLVTEAIMRALARRFGEDVEEWGLSGLLHDIDIELTEGDIYSHSRLGADLVREMGASETVAHAILCHNPVHGILPETKLDKALFCASPLATLIIAVIQISKDKKLVDIDAMSIVDKLSQGDFTTMVDREQISKCDELGLELEELVTLGLTAVQENSGDLGL